MKIIAFPKGLENPYQKLLYEALKRQGDVVKYVSLLFFLPQIFFWRLCGYNVFHLHWANAFLLRYRKLAYWHYLVCLKTLQLLGYKIVWTAHNVLPHEQAFPNDTIARKKLVDAADLVIAHSQSTLDGLAKIGIVPQRSVIIPHGSYVGVYPNAMSREDARKKLGIDQKIFTYLYLGQVREYKGVDTLIAAYEKIKNSGDKLIVAGKGSEIGHVAADELQTYFNAADVVVLPFKTITTSGSALLALSFGKAVIVPRLGDLALLPDEISYKYSPQESDGLIKAMKEAEKHPDILVKKSKAAQCYAEELGWPSIAEKTHRALSGLFQSR